MKTIKSNIYFIRSLLFLSLLIFFIIISFTFPSNIIISEIIDNETIFAYEYISGGDDDIAFGSAAIVFLPITIIYLINIFRKTKKEPLTILMATIIIQMFFTNMFLEYGNIFLTLLYGKFTIKLWVIIFGLIICYAIISLIIKFIIKMKKIFNYKFMNYE